MENWKAIQGYGDKYLVSDQGRVRRGDLLLAVLRGKYVNLSRKGGFDRVDIAYLVARAFLPNSEGRQWVRHKDGDVLNCRAENLEWVEEKVETRGRKKLKPTTDRTGAVQQFDREGNFVRVYDNPSEASDKTGVARKLIVRACNGEQDSAGGWVWRWE